MMFSIIIPVYNRPDEVDELLDSLTRQTVKDFEVVIVEDGSVVSCRRVCDKYEAKLDIQYFEKANSDPDRAATTAWSGRMAIMCSSSTLTWCCPRATSLPSAPNWSASLPTLSAVRTAPTRRSPTRRRPSLTQ